MGAFDIKYMPCTLVKGQILADLIAEFAESLVENESNEHRMDEKSVGLSARTIAVEGVRGQDSKSKRCGASFDLT